MYDSIIFLYIINLIRYADYFITLIFIMQICSFLSFDGIFQSKKHGVKVVSALCNFVLKQKIATFAERIYQ